MANLAALRAAVFSLSAKNLRGGGVEINPPPAGARVKAETHLNGESFRGPSHNEGVTFTRTVRERQRLRYYYITILIFALHKENT